MHFRKFNTLLIAIVLVNCSCTNSVTPAGLNASVASMRKYANSFEGLDMNEARNRLSGAKLSEERWSEDGVGGQELVAEFPHYEVRVLFHEELAITTSIQVISD